MFQKVLFVVVVVYYFINRVEINTNMDIMNVKAFKKKIIIHIEMCSGFMANLGAQINRFAAF